MRAISASLRYAAALGPPATSISSLSVMPSRHGKRPGLFTAPAITTKYELSSGAMESTTTESPLARAMEGTEKPPGAVWEGDPTGSSPVGGHARRGVAPNRRREGP